MRVIIRAPFWEWSSLDGDEENDNEHCKELLEEII